MKKLQSINHKDLLTLTPSIGFLGSGWNGLVLIESILKSGSARVKGIFDPSKNSAKRASEITTGVEVANSLEELIAMDLDGLIIATPGPLQARQAILALSAGLSVFCQKPFGQGAREAYSVVSAARSADRLLGLERSFRFIQEMKKIKELIKESAIGEIFNINLVSRSTAGGHSDSKVDRGGCLVDRAAQLIDYALWVMNYPEIRQVSGRMMSKSRPLEFSEIGVADFTNARLDLATGASISLSCSWGVPEGCDAVIEIVCYGASGTLSLKNVAGSNTDYELKHYRGEKHETIKDGSSDLGGRAVIEWAKQLAVSNAFDPEAESIQIVAKVLESLQRNPDGAVADLSTPSSRKLSLIKGAGACDL